MSDKPNYMQPREKTALDNPKLKLSAEKLPNGDGRPTLQVYWSGNNPRIDVYTNVKTDREGGKIRAALDDVVLKVFLNSILKLCLPETPNGTQYAIENKNYIYPGGKRSATPVLVSTLISGKDKEGRIFVSLLSSQDNVSKVMFRFGEHYYHSLVGRGNDNVLTPAFVSAEFAKAWVESINEVYALVAADNYTHKTAQPQQGGFNQQQGKQNRSYGNSNNNSYGGGGDDDDLSDDLPFG